MFASTAIKSKVPVILIPDTLGNCKLTYQMLLNPLAHFFQNIALFSDLRFESKEAASYLSIEDQADIIMGQYLKLIESNRNAVKTCYILGFSHGGHVAVALADKLTSKGYTVTSCTLDTPPPLNAKAHLGHLNPALTKYILELVNAAATRAELETLEIPTKTIKKIHEESLTLAEKLLKTQPDQSSLTKCYITILINKLMTLCKHQQDKINITQEADVSWKEFEFSRICHVIKFNLFSVSELRKSYSTDHALMTSETLSRFSIEPNDINGKLTLLDTHLQKEMSHLDLLSKENASAMAGLLYQQLTAPLSLELNTKSNRLQNAFNFSTRKSATQNITASLYI